MASILLLGLGLTSILLALAIISQLFKLTTSPSKSRFPPGNTGWPIIGETLAFVSSPEKFIRDRMNQRSPIIFQTSVAGERMAVFCTPSGNKFLFSNEAKLVTSWWPRSISDALISPFELGNSSSSELLEEQSVKFLKLESMQRYVPVIDSMAREHLEAHWVHYNEVKAYPLSKEFTFALACRLFVNFANPSPDQVRELAEPFFLVAEGILSAPINVRGTAFNRAVKAGEVVREKLIDIIRERKMEVLGNSNVEGLDLLGRLLMILDENGDFFKDKEIAGKIVGYLFASFYTTSTAVAFVIGYLAEHPHVYENVLKEQMEIAKSKRPGELLRWADVQKMKYSWNVVCESMRLAPPAQGAFKEVINDFTYAGYNIPKGWKVHWTVHSTNKDPRYFPDPEKFDPSRFEGHGPPPYTFVPFGGGPRMCPGTEYARIESLVFVHNVVTRFRLEKANPNENVVYDLGPVPVEGLRIRLQPHFSKKIQ